MPSSFAGQGRGDRFVCAGGGGEVAGFEVDSNDAAGITTLAQIAVRRDYLRSRPCIGPMSQEPSGALRLDVFEIGLTLDRCLQNWLRWAIVEVTGTRS